MLVYYCSRYVETLKEWSIKDVIITLLRKRLMIQSVSLPLCQTVEVKSQGQQCPVSVSTQMTGIGCYVSCMNDKLVVPGDYITAEDYHDRRLTAVG